MNRMFVEAAMPVGGCAVRPLVMSHTAGPSLTVVLDHTITENVSEGGKNIGGVRGEATHKKH